VYVPHAMPKNLEDARVGRGPRKRRGVERLCTPPGAPLRRGGVVGG